MENIDIQTQMQKDSSLYSENNKNIINDNSDINDNAAKEKISSAMENAVNVEESLSVDIVDDSTKQEFIEEEEKKENLTNTEEVKNNSSILNDIENHKIEDIKEEIVDNETKIIVNNETDEIKLEEYYNKLSKEELVKEIETIVSKKELDKTKISLIKVAFNKIVKAEQLDSQIKYIAAGGVKEEYVYKEDELEERFKKAFNIYKEKKAKFEEELEKQKIKNLEIKREIIEKLKKLVNINAPLKQTYDEFKSLQQQWKECGPVPQNEINDLWQNYHLCIEKFFDYIKINKELKDLDLKKNLENKIKLCEKVEDLLFEKSIVKTFTKLRDYQEEWKSIGPVPTDKNEEVWARFSSALEKLKEKRKQYYTNIKEQEEHNYNSKLALCEKVEQIIDEVQSFTSMKSWIATNNEVYEIEKMWKSIGYAPKDLNDQIWERFKNALNKYYKLKNDFIKKQKEEQLNNYNMKVALCVQAESLVAVTTTSNQWKTATDELLNLQKEWQRIGPVNPKNAEKLWKRFRNACDDFFNNKSKYYENRESIYIENLNKKKEIIKALNEINESDEKNIDINLIKNYQREWLEIGHVQLKDKDALQNEFKNVIDKLWAKLKVNSIDMANIEFKSRFEKLKENPSPNTKKIILEEQNTIKRQINKIKNDINLWENNLGFFAHSAKADELKKDFETKIQKSKEELLKLEDKLNFLIQLLK